MLEAGKYVARGSFGCFFSPSIPCKGTVRNVNDATKVIFKEESAFEEIAETLRVKALDPRQIWSSYPTSACPRRFKSVKSIESELDTSKCASLITKLKKRRQSIRENTPIYLLTTHNAAQSIDLDHYVRIRNYDKVRIIREYENVIHGLMHFHKNLFYHLDLDDTNMVISKEPNPQIQGIRLIDFGNSYDGNDFLNHGTRAKNREEYNIQRYTSDRINALMASIWYWINHLDLMHSVSVDEGLKLTMAGIDDKGSRESIDDLKSLWNETPHLRVPAFQSSKTMYALFRANLETLKRHLKEHGTSSRKAREPLVRAIAYQDYHQFVFLLGEFMRPFKETPTIRKLFEILKEPLAKSDVVTNWSGKGLPWSKILPLYQTVAKTL